MKLETAKEKCIREAYEKHGYDWNEIKQVVSPDGWCNCRVAHVLALSGEQEDSECGHYVRPKSLQGIENNNGWIKIESEADLPERNDEQEYYWIHEGSIHEMRLDPCHYDKPKVILSHYSHWRKKEEIPHPIY